MEADIWGASALQLAWHAAIANVTTHTAFCLPCQHADAWDHKRRCAEGRQLSEIEQAAWREQITERYAGAVA